jgi:hypothetical protein
MHGSREGQAAPLVVNDDKVNTIPPVFAAHAWFKILFCEVCVKVVVDFERLEVLFDHLNLGRIKDVPPS